MIGCALAGVVVEGGNRSLELSALPDRAPSVYRWLAAQTRGAVCEYPLGNLSGRVGPQDPTYEYYSTQHWQPLVNGYSGFEPASYRDMKEQLRTFPNAASINYLRQRHVRYLLVHQGFYINGDYYGDVRALRQQTGLAWVGTFRWRDGTESTAFRIDER
jgi:hypothetical protein